MHKPFLRIAAFIGALSVAGGAFGAHALKQVLSPEKLQVFETAVRYQFYHVFALLAAGILFQAFPVTLMKWSGRLFITGILLFCGSLYLLVALPDNFKWLGAITPFGGASFIAGWCCMLLAFRKAKSLNSKL
jgi:uncharacterized membrane protein YgdD (TMEM256/DUF423 family)